MDGMSEINSMRVDAPDMGDEDGVDTTDVRGEGAAGEVSRCVFFFSSRRRHTRFDCDWSSDVCSSDLVPADHADTAGGIDDAHRPIGGESPALLEPVAPRRRLAGGASEGTGEREHERSEERRVGEEGRSRWSPYH